MKPSLEKLGHTAVNAVVYAGGVSTLFMQTLFWVAAPPFRARQVLDQMIKTGVNSAPISTLTSFFIGVVIAFQSAYQMQKVGGEMYIPSLVSISVTREIGPLLTALVVAGRVGARHRGPGPSLHHAAEAARRSGGRGGRCGRPAARADRALADAGLAGEPLGEHGTSPLVRLAPFRL